jgi:dTDP-4-dehydrorhamnose 3,5-epimerase
MSAPQNWLFAGTPDTQRTNSEWEEVGQPAIDGVTVHPVKNVLTDNGYLTEIFRSDWGLPGGKIEQVFIRTLEPGTVTAWHCHARTTDRLFCLTGRILLVLYDGRANSRTARTLFKLRFGIERPSLVVVPCGVWHGVKNLSAQSCILLNAVDEAYAYEAPDHWRLPQQNAEIPFDFDRMS